MQIENDQLEKSLARGQLLEFKRELICRRDFANGTNIYWTKNIHIYENEEVVRYSVKVLVKDGTNAQEFGTDEYKGSYKQFWNWVDKAEKEVENLKEKGLLQEDSKITRFEIINHSECLPLLERDYSPVRGRNSIVLQNENEFIIDYDLQDNGQTLKVFIQDKLPLNKIYHKHQIPPYSDLKSEVPIGTTFIHEHICKCSAIVKYRVLRTKDHPFNKYLLLTKFDKDGNEQIITEKDF